MRSDRRRDRRMNGNTENTFSLKNTLYIVGTILALGIIAFFITVMVYNNSVNKLYSELETKEIGEVRENEPERDGISNAIEEASANLGKTVNEMVNQTTVTRETSAENEEAKQTTTTPKEEKTEKETKTEEKKDTKSENKTTESNTVKDTETTKKETKKEEKVLEFAMPVEGEVQKEYAKDKLVYSETLKEWVTHTGIDIKAEKTTVVKAAEEGTVTAIKNDPRYGTTVIIEHNDGYETRYANLLTAEFVTVGEKVTKGQTIGTVGDTGAFEILDEPHLHFEVLKDGEYQDPTSIIK